MPEQNPISQEAREEIYSDFSAELASVIYSKTGWKIALLTADSEGWVYAANELPDGKILDVNDYTEDGSHILNDELLYGLFDEDELEASSGEVSLRILEDSESFAQSFSPTIEKEFFNEIADSLIEWVDFNEEEEEEIEANAH